MFRKAINIDAELGRIRDGKLKDRIYRVGIELEGGWAKVPQGVSLIRDGSLDGMPKQVSVGGKAVVLAIGELPSEPLERAKVKTWMEQVYPSHVDAHCGLHAHVSFRNALHYQDLMVPEYQDTVIEYLTRWAKEQNLPEDHVIWPRLRGENRYCTHDFFPDAQASKTTKNYGHEGEGHRYTAINYCYGQHSTIEERMLPMFQTWQQAFAAVDRFFDITNACIYVLGQNAAPRQEIVLHEDPHDRVIEYTTQVI